MAKSMFVSMVSGAFILIATAVDATEVPSESGCIPFRWAPWPGVTDKSAVMVPARVNGKDSMEFQLDTGAFRSYINANVDSFSKRLPTPTAIVSLAIAGVQLNTNNIHINAPDVNNGNTLGLAQLLGTVVVLDMKATTICIYEGKSAPKTVIEQFKWTAGEFRHGHMLTPGWIGKKKISLMLDTGSGYFELYTSKANWQDITRESPSKINSVIAGNVWGKTAKFQGAFAKMNLRIGDFETVSPLLAFHREDDPDIFQSGGYYGIVGLSLFSDSSLAFDFSSQPPRLGISKH